MRVTITHVVFLLAFWPFRAAAQSTAPGPAVDAFAGGAWHLELAGHAAVEAWNYNVSREQMAGMNAGLTYGLRRGLQLTVRAPLYYVDQRGVDGVLFGLTGGVRGRVYGGERMSVFWEVDVGISESDTMVPPRGTRFNYLALGGAGATVRLRTGLHLLASLRWAHVSNGGLAGRDRNPDLEAVGPQVGILMGF